MEQGRVILAVALSLLIWLVYDTFVLRPWQADHPQPPEPRQLAVNDPQGAARDLPVSPGEPQPEVAAFAAPLSDENLIEVETDLYHARVDPHGARLASFELKRYRQGVQEDSPPLDLVLHEAAPRQILPLTVQLADGDSDVATAYRSDATTLRVSGTDGASIVLSGETKGGLGIQKTLSFRGDSYAIGVSVKIDNDIPVVGLLVPPVAAGPATGGYADLAVTLTAEGLKERTLADVAEEEPSQYEAAKWVGFSGQYFASVVVSTATPGRAVIAHAGDTPYVRLDLPVSDGAANFEVLLAPKDQKTLAEAGHDLDRVLDFGKLWFVAVPILELMRLINRFVGNYGVAIIVLSILIKVVTFPLNQASMKSMKKMQEIQPQLKRLQERHKDDQPAMQKEMMELYKRHGVNPLSGCLPMLLQMPIFIGLWNALGQAIELRHAPFVSWINDLSAPDRLMVASVGIPVLTLLMGASMLVQQLMTPAQGDPNQRRMMMFMPVIFTFFFINMPSGLVLYWFVSNLLAIGQQMVTMRSKQGAVA
jgi:YidC/Oxa1 family membrane protein insertase